MQIAYLDGPRLRRALLAACQHAQGQRAELNRINVFPVPDGDTGTNLALTLRAIADHLAGEASSSVSAVARRAADAAVLGARGNCGMMLSHFLLGFAESLGDRSRVGTDAFADALEAGVAHLGSALERPVEGTILTVMRDTARAARSEPTHDFGPLVEHLVDAARASLARTPDLLPVLRRSGVVDAGAKGFVAMLEGALLDLRGHALGATPPTPPDLHAPVASAEATDARFRYCTEALVRGPALPAEGVVRERLRGQGDSLIVIRTGQVLKVHIHTDDPDEVFGYLRRLGRLATHKAEDVHAQHAAVERHGGEGPARLVRRPVVIATDSASDLPEEVVRAHGIQVTPLVLIDGDRTLRDGVDISADEFHRRLEAGAGDLPTTSQPAPADFLATWARAAEDGEAVVAVVLGSALSGTYASAEAAQRRFEGAKLRVVDSRGASLLQGLLVLRAAELAELGRTPDHIVEAIAALRERSGLLFTVDTFDRLLASGRVTRGQAFVGSMLHLKPVLALDAQGAVVPVGKAVGRRRVRELLLDELDARLPPDRAKVRFGVVHVGAPHVVKELRDALERRFGAREVLAAPVTPVIATHTGVGAWGVAWLVDE